MCILLCQQNLFTTCGHYHLVVGHTHEDVDGALSLVTTCLRQERSLQTPADVIRCLEKKLSPVFAKKNMAFGVELIDEVSGLVLTSIFTVSLFPPSLFVGSLALNDWDRITCSLLYVHVLRFATGLA